jgi:hypothetical protein
MTPDCCESLLQAVRQANLVPWRTVYRRGLLIPAAPTPVQATLLINLKRSERARGYTLVLKARHTLDGADDVILQYAVNDPLQGGDVLAEMAAQQTLYLCPGETMTLPLPGWADRITLVLRGALAADPAAPADVWAHVLVYQNEPTLYPEGC